MEPCLTFLQAGPWFIFLQANSCLMFLKVCSSLYPLKLNILLQLASACHLINLEQEKTLNMARAFEMRLNCYSILYVKSQPGKKEVSLHQTLLTASYIGSTPDPVMPSLPTSKCFFTRLEVLCKFGELERLQTPGNRTLQSYLVYSTFSLLRS